LRNHQQANDLHYFSTIGAQFCTIVVHATSLEKDAFIVGIRAALAELYLAALRLPDIAPLTVDGHVDRLQDAQQAVYDGVAARLGTDRTYWTIFDPHVQSDPILGDLADELSDIYWDIDQGLHLAKQGEASGDVLWTWRNSFCSHWRRHAADALRAAKSNHRLIMQCACQSPT
jgi:uncharacterized protein DUF5063